MKLSGLFRNQKGMTLVELMMAVGVTGIILSGIGFVIYRVLDTNSRASTHMTAVKQVENAVHFISRDAEKAQFALNPAAVSPHSFGESPFLVLTWVNDFDNTAGSVTYTRDGTKLVRTYTDSSGQAAVNVVAEHIDFDRTFWGLTASQTEAPVLTFTVTSTINTAKPSTETRSFQVIPRSLP
jgi:prepilin-type N-terminal cleavage/methylation domain-containing protein